MDHETSDLGRRVDKVPTLNIKYQKYQQQQIEEKNQYIQKK